jgi:hypothetical protein
MNTRMLLFILVTSLFLLLLVGVAGYYYRRSRRVSASSWEDLLARLAAVNHHTIEQIAFDAIDESGHPRTDSHAKALRPEEIWQLVGGLQGLEILESNSLVLIDIASHLQQWYPEALETAGDLRLKAREIQWHVSRLRTAARTGALEGWFANYAQNTVAAYYLMTRSLLALYQTGRMPLLADIQRAL